MSEQTAALQNYNRDNPWGGFATFCEFDRARPETSEQYLHSARTAVWRETRERNRAAAKEKAEEELAYKTRREQALRGERGWVRKAWLSVEEVIKKKKKNKRNKN
jgi:hypothetical protein